MTTKVELPTATQHFWIYGTAAANYADILGRTLQNAALARELEQTAAHLRDLVLRAGQPYRDPAAAAEQRAAQRQAANLRRRAGH